MSLLPVVELKDILPEIFYPRSSTRGILPEVFYPRYSTHGFCRTYTPCETLRSASSSLVAHLTPLRLPSTSFATIFHTRPVSCPFFSPSEGPTTSLTNLLCQMEFMMSHDLVPRLASRNSPDYRVGRSCFPLPTGGDKYLSGPRFRPAFQG